MAVAEKEGVKKFLELVVEQQTNLPLTIKPDQAAGVRGILFMGPERRRPAGKKSGIAAYAAFSRHGDPPGLFHRILPEQGRLVMRCLVGMRPC